MEDLAFDGASLHDSALGGVELVEPGCEQRAERRRHLDLVLALGVACHRQHLGDEERVASGRPLDPRSEPWRDAVADQRADVVVVEWLQPDGDGPGRSAVEQLWAGDADEEERNGRREERHVLDQVEERVGSPLDVVDEDDERRLLAEELPERPGDLLHRRRLFALTEQRADGRGGRRVAWQGAELLDDLDNGPVCDLLAVGKTARFDDPRVHPLESLGDETRLADTGLAQHGHELARALGARALPRPTKELQLTRASDEGPVVQTVRRLPDR